MKLAIRQRVPALIKVISEFVDFERFFGIRANPGRRVAYPASGGDGVGRGEERRAGDACGTYPVEDRPCLLRQVVVRELALVGVNAAAADVEVATRERA